MARKTRVDLLPQEKQAIVRQAILARGGSSEDIRPTELQVAVDAVLPRERRPVITGYIQYAHWLPRTLEEIKAHDNLIVNHLVREAQEVRAACATPAKATEVKATTTASMRSASAVKILTVGLTHYQRQEVSARAPRAQVSHLTTTESIRLTKDDAVDHSSKADVVVCNEAVTPLSALSVLKNHKGFNGFSRYSRRRMATDLSRTIGSL